MSVRIWCGVAAGVACISSCSDAAAPVASAATSTNDLVDGGLNTITKNGFHQAVQVGEVVFDNFLREGASYESYLGALQARYGVSVVETAF